MEPTLKSKNTENGSALLNFIDSMINFQKKCQEVDKIYIKSIPSCSANYEKYIKRWSASYTLRVMIPVHKLIYQI